MTQQDKKILCAWMRRAKKVNSEINEKAQELKALMGEEESNADVITTLQPVRSVV